MVHRKPPLKPLIREWQAFFSNMYTKEAVIKTIVYSDIFDFPLRKDELWRFLLSSKKVTRDSFEKALQNTIDIIKNRDGYYYLTGRAKIVEKRKNNIHQVKKKLRIAKNKSNEHTKIP